jgi:hypothetical protein
VHGREHLFTHSFFLPPRWRSNCSFRTPSPVSVRIQKMTSMTSSVQLIEALGGWDTTRLLSDKAVACKEECKDHRDSHCLVESVPRWQVHGAVHKYSAIGAILLDSMLQRWACLLQTHQSFHE